MGSLLPLTRASELARKPRPVPTAPPRQLDLVLDDIRLQSVTAAQRQAVLKAMAQLLIEASGAVTVEGAMTTHDAVLPATVLQRKAVVYVRQSTPQQVQANLESQRRQYELVDVRAGAVLRTSR